MGIKIELAKQPNWQEWYDYSKRVIGLLNIARIGIMCRCCVTSIGCRYGALPTAL